eukprot:1686670-Pleurochrysis_carterae.AAC.1
MQVVIVWARGWHRKSGARARIRTFAAQKRLGYGVARAKGQRKDRRQEEPQRARPNRPGLRCLGGGE